MDPIRGSQRALTEFQSQSTLGIRRTGRKHPLAHPALVARPYHPSRCSAGALNAQMWGPPNQKRVESDASACGVLRPTEERSPTVHSPNFYLSFPFVHQPPVLHSQGPAARPVQLARGRAVFRTSPAGSGTTVLSRSSPSPARCRRPRPRCRPGPASCSTLRSWKRRLHPDGNGYWEERLRRWHLHLRRRRFLRLDRWNPPQQARSWAWSPPGRARLLGGGQRRRRVRLR
jgi:hypothetical protein